MSYFHKFIETRSYIRYNTDISFAEIAEIPEECFFSFGSACFKITQ